jgi:hypothetical protein
MKYERFEPFVVAAIFIGCLFLWTQPIQANPIPYGESDATSHFIVADWQSHTDRSMFNLPPYIDFRYGTDNRFKEHTLWYPPNFHTVLAVIQSLTGSRFVSFYFMIAIMCSAFILPVYLLVRQLYGKLTATLASTLLIFSGRDILVFLWGQWPERLGYAFIPLILLFYYKYVSSKLNGTPKPAYIYLSGALLASGALIHPASLFHATLALLIFSVVMLVKHREIPFKTKHILITGVIVMVMLLAFPYQTGNVFLRTSAEKAEPTSPARLLSWFKAPEENVGVPEAYFSYGAMNGWWTLPFLIIGLFIVLFRKKSDGDWLMLSWLAMLYIMIHLDVIGKGTRIHRSLAEEAHIFYPFIALGVTQLATVFKTNYKKIITVLVTVVFLGLMINYSLLPRIPMLQNAYSGGVRLNENQISAADWIEQNVAEDEYVYVVTAPYRMKMDWIRAYSRRLADEPEIFDLTSDYVLVDYSDVMNTNELSKDVYAGLTRIEESISGEVVYNKGFIKIFDVRRDG